MSRPASDPRIGKVGGPGFELDLVYVEPEAVRRDLSQCGPGALTHVVRADLHDAAAVSTQHGSGLGMEHERRKCRRADAPADEQSVRVAHLPGCERAPFPAETIGALPIAVAQRLGGERLAG